MSDLIKNETTIYRNCLSCNNILFECDENENEIGLCRYDDNIVIKEKFTKYDLNNDCRCDGWRFSVKVLNPIADFYQEFSNKKCNELAC